MTAKTYLRIGIGGLACGLGALLYGMAPSDPELRVSVVDAAGRPVRALVTVRAAGSPVAHSRLADAGGQLSLREVPAGMVEVSARAPGLAPALDSATLGAARSEVRLQLRPATTAELSSAALLALLPDGEERRRFVLDCTGCHVFDRRIALPNNQPRPRDNWVAAVHRMLGFAGPASNFPVIGAGREAEPTAALLSGALYAGDTLRTGREMAYEPAAGELTEYDLPAPQDLPHDVAVLADGRVLITGMFTSQMYVLDPATGATELVPIPVQGGNPRAVELDAEGDWWVVLGGPRRLAEYDVSEKTWRSFDVGVYAHSLAVAPDQRVWYNGHFTRNPQVLGVVEPGTGTVTPLEVPAHPQAGVGAGPIPYELRAAADGSIWGSELVGNRVYRYDPASGQYALFDMPLPHSGPRRLDIGPDGIVWIPEFSGGALTRLDPQTGRFDRYELPIPLAAPYVARVNPTTGDVWLAVGAGDAVFRFTPATRRFQIYPLATSGALVRHMDIADNGDVWLAYGASPGGVARVARLRP